jgi:hypothetical protein
VLFKDWEMNLLFEIYAVFNAMAQLIEECRFTSANVPEN